MSKPLTESEVRHIAMLGRLQLSDDEIAMMTEELSAIVGYVDQLSEVDVEGVEPTAHAVNVQNVFRDDVVRDSIGPDKALANAPQREDSFFRVPKVLDQDTV
ncbi:MAG TPA: Asp-tRNA(Asn)/Glu-tRNA(Gln) amidotransferase subunit GatC [Phycisphaerae bacterium]|nr:Asp-tRNA(Asn)/Glu-tRNA(Gln) amidotransferase subunit GatC [Phycisphaerales bacterium]HNO77844.1 Asp-tRNA(Asn)/Glu-tRNA(Gln) amidotransferase subunit GatC [Phycisphaerae bacterium]